VVAAIRESKILKETSIQLQLLYLYGIPRLRPAIVSRDSAREPIGRVTAAAVSSRPVIIHILLL